jgi:hypothetical protein
MKAVSFNNISKNKFGSRKTKSLDSSKFDKDKFNDEMMIHKNKNTDSNSKPYYVYDSKTGNKHYFYNREDAEEYSTSYREKNDLPYKPEVHRNYNDYPTVRDEIKASEDESKQEQYTRLQNSKEITKAGLDTRTGEKATKERLEEQKLINHNRQEAYLSDKGDRDDELPSISEKEYRETSKDYKGKIKGQTYLLDRNKKGETIYYPVKVENKPKYNSKYKIVGKDTNGKKFVKHVDNPSNYNLLNANVYENKDGKYVKVQEVREGVHIDKTKSSKPEYEYEVMGRYGGSPEVVTTETSKSEAEERLKEYRENERGTNFFIHKKKLNECFERQPHGYKQTEKLRVVKDNETLAKQFLLGNEGKTKSMKAKNNKLYSYETPIAEKTGQNEITVANKKYSSTTSKQITILKRVANANNIKVNEKSEINDNKKYKAELKRTEAMRYKSPSKKAVKEAEARQKEYDTPFWKKW